MRQIANATNSEKRQKQTRRVNFATINNRFLRSVLFTEWTQRRRCFYKRTCVRVEFLHQRERTKRKLFTDLRGIRSTCGAEE